MRPLSKARRGNPCGCPVRQPEQRTAAEFCLKPPNSAGELRILRGAQNSAGIECSGAFATGCQGLNFYGCYDPNREKDRKLFRWATTKVSKKLGFSEKSCYRCRWTTRPLP